MSYTPIQSDLKESIILKSMYKDFLTNEVPIFLNIIVEATIKSLFAHLYTDIEVYGDDKYKGYFYLDFCEQNNIPHKRDGGKGIYFIFKFKELIENSFLREKFPEIEFLNQHGHELLSALEKIAGHIKTGYIAVEDNCATVSINDYFKFEHDKKLLFPMLNKMDDLSFIYEGENRMTIQVLDSNK